MLGCNSHLLECLADRRGEEVFVVWLAAAAGEADLALVMLDQLRSLCEEEMRFAIDVVEEQKNAGDGASSRFDSARPVRGKESPDFFEIGGRILVMGRSRPLSVVVLVGPAGFEPATNRL